MARRRTPTREATDRVTVDRFDAPRQHLTRGDEVTVDLRHAGSTRPRRERCAFVGYTVHESGAEWLDVITARGYARTIRPERIDRVHRSRRLAVLAS